MTARLKAFSRVFSPGVWILASLSMLIGAGAGQAAPESLRQGMFGARPSPDGRQMPGPQISRYVSEDGDLFVLDLSQPHPLLKYDNSLEVWALRPQPGPRGDMIYKNDLGEPMVRATRLGGITIFTQDHPAGEAAAVAGAGLPLRLAALGPQALAERLLQASARASHAARRLIPFEAEATPASSALIADAALVTSEAVVRMTRRADVHRLLDKVLKVRLVSGRKPQVEIEQGVLEVTVSPPDGLAGRPSSERIVQVTESLR